MVWVTFNAGSPTNLDLRKGGGYWACSRCGWGVFSLPVQMYRESYYTNPGVSVGRAIRVSKMLKFTVKFYCDGKALYLDRSSFSTAYHIFLSPF